MAFVKAQKSQISPTVVLEGPTGSGKTFSALAIASGMGKKIAVIDTERSSSAYYADRFAFDVCELHDWTLKGYLKEARDAAKSGYDVLIIDSASHGWKKLTEEMEDASAKYRGNSMTAWTKDGKPAWNNFVDELFSLGMAVIVTTRVKQAYDIGKDENGKTKIEKLGLEAQAEKDFDYEFGIVLRMDQDHNALVTKDRTGKFQDQIIKKPGPEFGKALMEWLSTGVPAKPKAPVISDEEHKVAKDEMDKLLVELAQTVTATVGAVSAFGDNRKAYYRSEKENIKAAGVSALTALRDLALEATVELSAIRKAWEAAGSPTPATDIIEKCREAAKVAA